VAAELYEDPSILLGFVETDEAIELSSTQPTVAILADRQQAPTIIAWSPAEHPGVKTIAELGKDGTTVLYYNGAPFMSYLTGAGILSSKQMDGAYNGTPAQFVASGGKDALQGFATAEPYEYAHEVSEWDKPLTYQLVSTYGYDPYPALATMPQNITKHAACFKKLVPIIQHGIADYAANPGPADALIVKLAQEYNTGWVYDTGEAADVAADMAEERPAHQPGRRLVLPHPVQPAELPGPDPRAAQRAADIGDGVEIDAGADQEPAGTGQHPIQIAVDLLRGELIRPRRGGLLHPDARAGFRDQIVQPIGAF
jgi:hypothetical protein